ncbi:MAG: GDP-mannose 4,6-dehydratase [bacterium]|nr:GDP-mannose 4,6-dehydratase [bacterium]
MKNKTAIITGITGQDGCYLAKLLLEKQYRVIGTLDPNRQSSLHGLKLVDALSNVDLRDCNLFSFSDVQRLILENEPNEIYHLAGQSSVSESFRQPVHTMELNTRPVINFLDAIRTISRETRFYHASSSEMFGKADTLPVTEQTHFRPVSPYAVSKVAAHNCVSCYRDSYGLFAVSGVLFNHESPLRRPHFFTQRLVRQAREVAAGTRRRIRLGNIEVRRDFGYAPDYVDAMWRMLQHEVPYDFLICSGQSVPLRELVEHVLSRFGLPIECIHIDPELFRPNEIPDMFGSNQFAREQLDWNYALGPCEVMDILINARCNFGHGEDSNDRIASLVGSI